MGKTVIWDQLYGEMEFNDQELELVEHPLMQRLKQVSLSAVPPRLQGNKTCASKWEHSLGATYLAKKVNLSDELIQYQKEIISAALLHDVGTPPFSHASEYFLIKTLGRNHEAYATNILETSGVNKVLKAQNIESALVSKLIEGNDEVWGQIINGPLDVDNLDNSLRFGLTLGIVNKPSYHPERIAQVIEVDTRGVNLTKIPEDELRAWEETRKKVYNYVYSEQNLVPGLMLYRAMDFAYHLQELPISFFQMTDEDAWEYLSSRTNRQTRKLMMLANEKRLYTQVINQRVDKPSMRLKKLVSDTEKRWILANLLAQKLKAVPESVTIYLNWDKSYKQINQGGKSLLKPNIVIQICVSKELTGQQNLIQKFLEDEIL